VRVSEDQTEPGHENSTAVDPPKGTAEGRLFRTSLRGRWTAGAAGSLLVVVGVACVAFVVPSQPGEELGLTAIALAFVLLGLVAVYIGATPRRHWVRVDADGISKPWALGHPGLRWADIGNVTYSGWGGIRIRARHGSSSFVVQLEVDGFQDLLDIVLDRTATLAPSPPWELAGSKRFSSSRTAVATDGACVAVSTGTERVVVAAADLERVQVVLGRAWKPQAVLVRRDGASLLVPAVPGVDPLHVYRALRALLASRQGAEGHATAVSGSEGSISNAVSLFDQSRRAAIKRILWTAGGAALATSLVRSCARTPKRRR
jgi:hypothetical protein